MAGVPATDDINVVIVEDDDDSVREVDGNIEIDTPDGGVIVRFDPPRPSDPSVNNPADFYKNIADKIGGSELLTIANELMEAIEADDNSRQESLANRAKGMDLLGLQIDEPRSGDGAAQMDGMSIVTNPLLLDAVLKGWANAQAEFLPAEGPCKVADFGDEPDQARDDLAEVYERDMNYYLTSVATEYAPETSHMLLWGTFFGGAGFKKVYMHPLKNRPTSEKVDTKDLIVSDATTDLKSCERITHQISMRQSLMKRMMAKGIYRDITLTPPTPTPNQVEEKTAQIQGVATAKSRPEDQPYTLWETQCELDLDAFAPPQFKGKGIPLPYLVTLDKDSREILSIRRDWKPEDENCERKRMYVKYPYVPGPGFYGTGLLNILGNSTAAMTAAWRMSLDAGMLANFPAFLIAKLAGRQNTSDIVMSPATGTPIETGNRSIRDVVMELPYKDVTSGLMTMMDKITEQSRSAGAAAEIPVGEGIQNVPVGTMLAHIETATKLMAATHKLMHNAQDEELGLLADLFRENPESFWKHNKRAKNFWNEEKLFIALNTVSLVPKSDPNIPSHIHRVMKAVALTELQAGPLGALMDPMETLKRVLSAMREDPKGLIKPLPPSDGKPSPDEITANAKLITAQAKAAEIPIKAQETEERAALEKTKTDGTIKAKTIDLARSIITHGGEREDATHQRTMDHVGKHLEVDKHLHDKEVANRELDLKERQHQLGVSTAATDAALGAEKATTEASRAFEKDRGLHTPAGGKPKKK